MSSVPARAPAGVRRGRAALAAGLLALMLVGGAVMMSLGIIAQYIGAATNMSLGKPLYVVVRDPARTFGDDPGIR